MSETEFFIGLAVIFGILLIAAVHYALWRNRRPRKADRAYHASLREVAASSYEDDGVHGDVVIVPRRMEG